MNKIYYGITSYHRPECRTLKTLLDMGIDKERIVISLNDEEDFKEYHKRYPDIKIITKKGNSAASNRNNLLNYFQKGTFLIILDDDLINYKKWEPDLTTSKYGKLVNINAEEFEAVLYDCYKNIKDVDGEFFGIYQISNTMMISSTIKGNGIYDVNKIFQGGTFGFIVGDERFDENFPVLDDYALILKNISQGKIVLRRNDLVATKPKNETNKGGCYELYKSGKKEEALNKLKKMYPNLIQIKKDYSGIILKRGL